MNEKIDFVLIWVDGSDFEWRKEKNKYAGLPDEEINGEIRYRDWENLKYWFRGVEKFAPWVNNVYFVTCGHYPKWINFDCPKLKFVRHEEFIPKEYLPTFSSHTIELNLHRINGLSEKFVYFNDDTFLIRNAEEKDFFENSLPKRLVEETILAGEDNVMPYVHTTNMMLINKNFDKKSVVKKSVKKYFNYKYGIKNNVRKMLLLPFKNFAFFNDPHLPSPMLKSTYEELWKKEFELLDKVSKDKFRQPIAVNQYLFKFWDICKGNYIPTNYNDSKYIGVTCENCKVVAEEIKKQKYTQMCINDIDSKGDFEKMKNEINAAFESILPEKSMFEK